MKKMYFAWGLLMACFMLALILTGLNVQQETKHYSALENDMIEAADTYMKVKNKTVNAGSSIKLDEKTLVEEKLIPKMEVEEDKCTGYVLIKKSAGITYKSYIKCKNYTTDGYKE